MLHKKLTVLIGLSTFLIGVVVSYGWRSHKVLEDSSVEVNQKESAALKPTKMLVEVWCGGDDNLTRGVCIATENAFEANADFALSNGANNRALVVTIPTNVDWKEMNQRTRVFYTVEFSSVDAKEIRKRKGACWEDDFAACANQIVKEAKIAQRKMPAKH